MVSERFPCDGLEFVVEFRKPQEVILSSYVLVGNRRTYRMQSSPPIKESGGSYGVAFPFRVDLAGPPKEGERISPMDIGGEIRYPCDGVEVLVELHPGVVILHASVIFEGKPLYTLKDSGPMRGTGDSFKIKFPNRLDLAGKAGWSKS